MDILKRIAQAQQFCKFYADGAYSIEKEKWSYHVNPEFIEDIRQYIESLQLKLMHLQTQQAHSADAQPEQEPVTILPDGSAFGVMSFPLPDDHWLYAPNEYRDGEYEPIDLPKPILTHALREAVVASVRYAVRGATLRGQETDFDPDALVQNAVYALCGPYTTPPAAQRKPLTEDVIWEIWHRMPKDGAITVTAFARAIEAKLKEKNNA
jgi:hypothetical protein